MVVHNAAWRTKYAQARLVVPLY